MQFTQYVYYFVEVSTVNVISSDFKIINYDLLLYEFVKKEDGGIKYDNNNVIEEKEKKKYKRWSTLIIFLCVEEEKEMMIIRIN